MIHSAVAERPIRKEGRESSLGIASSESANLDVLRAMAVFIVLVGHLLQRGEHRLEHRYGEPSRIGVVPRAVIAVGQQPAVRQRMQAAMREQLALEASAEVHAVGRRTGEALS